MQARRWWAVLVVLLLSWSRTTGEESPTSPYALAPVRAEGKPSPAPDAPRPQGAPPPPAVALDPPRPEAASNQVLPAADGFSRPPSAPTEALPGVATPGMLGDLPPNALVEIAPGRGPAPAPVRVDPGPPSVRLPPTTAG